MEDRAADGSARSIEKRLQRLFAAAEYRPLRRSELARELGLGPDLRTELRHALKRLEDRGVVLHIRRNRYAPPDRGVEMTGLLTLHPSGFGFVADDEDPDREAFVPRQALRYALHGDRVRVAVAESPARRLATRGDVSRLRGRVLEVVDRPTPDVVGTVQHTPYYACVVPDDPRHTRTIRLRPDATGTIRLPPPGRKVVVRLDPWKPDAEVPTGEVVEDIGEASDPAVAMPALMRRHGIAATFPPPVEREARARRSRLARNDLAGREDLRDATLFTIDPEDARDFDDAVSLARLPGGAWRLGVHIADVAHFVEAGSATDREARDRATSTYLVDRTVTMLPTRLTTEVCSLQPETDHLAHSVEMELTPGGDPVRVRTFRSVIRSRARLDYRGVQRFFDSGAMDGSLPQDVASDLVQMRELAQVLRGRRRAEGALEMQTPEVRCRLDREGRVLGIERRSEIEAYRVIEEFMLQANQAVARRLGEAGSPCLYRIHDEPGAAQWAEMETDLAALGFPLPARTRGEVNRVLTKAAGTTLAYPATLAVLRNLKRAMYAPHHRPHFGLAFRDYAHFTSPIRRYPDLVTHRLLCAVENGEAPPYDHADLKTLGVHCSSRERAAEEAERESVDIKRVEYYADRFDTGDTGPWPAVVVSAIPRGWIVELPDTLQRGLVPFSALPGGYAGHAAFRSRGSARRPMERVPLGQTLAVRLSRVDLRRRRIDFAPDEGIRAPTGAATRKPRGRKRERHASRERRD